MRDAEFFRDKARQCRELLNLAIVPEIIEQLTLWAEEFEREAEKSKQEHSASRRFRRRHLIEARDGVRSP